MEFAYFTLARFLLACRLGLSPNEVHDAGIEEGFLVPLPPRIRTIIDARGFFRWLEGGVHFDQARALLAYRRSKEIDWAVFVNHTNAFLRYAWDTGDVSAVAEHDGPGEQTWPANPLV